MPKLDDNNDTIKKRIRVGCEWSEIYKPSG